MPGSKQAWPNNAACWSPATPAIGIAAEQRRLGVAEIAAGVAHLGQDARGTRTSSAIHRPIARCRYRRAWCARRWRHRSRALPPVSRQTDSYRWCRTRVRRARPAPARRGHGREPGEFGGGKIGVDDETGFAGSSARGHRLFSSSQTPRCGGPARRWLVHGLARSRGPKPRSSRAGW